MGLKKSAFKFEASLTDKKTIQDVVDDVSNVFKNAGSQWTIAMSDIVLLAEGDQKYGDDFYIISGRKIQNLETQYQSTERGYAKRLKRSKVQPAGFLQSSGALPDLVLPSSMMRRKRRTKYDVQSAFD